MLEDYKFWAANIAVFMTLYAYYPYLKGIFRGRTKPHCFTWLVWSLVSIIAVIIQIVEGGGMGAWPTLAAVFTCLLITILALFKGSKDIKLIDYVFFGLSLSAIPLWVLFKDPVYSALLVTGIEIVAALPTLRKSWHKPEEEVALTYGLNTARYMLSIVALEALNIATTAYPAGMVFMNGMIFFVLIIRGRILSKLKIGA